LGLTFGFDFAYSSGKVDLNNDYSTLDVSTVSIGSYGSYEFNNGLFIDGMFGLGLSDIDYTEEQDLGNPTITNYKTRSMQLGFELGYNGKIADALYILPSVGLNYIHIKQDIFEEKYLPILNKYNDTKFNYLEIPVTLKVQ
jgi:outer membrane autotransporter protein